MSQRYTRKDAVAALELLAKEAGFKLWGPNAQSGLNVNSVLGGFEVVRVVEPGGGEGCPFGYETYTAKELTGRLNFARLVVERMKEGEG